MSRKNRSTLVSLGECDPGGGLEMALAALEGVQFSAPRWHPQPPLSPLMGSPVLSFSICGLLYAWSIHKHTHMHTHHKNPPWF